MNTSTQPKHTPKFLPVESLTYEQALHELEEIVISLEQESLPLDTAMDLFERGQQLARHCAGLLDSAEIKIQQIVGGNLIDFNPENK